MASFGFGDDNNDDDEDIGDGPMFQPEASFGSAHLSPHRQQQSKLNSSSASSASQSQSQAWHDLMEHATLEHAKTVHSIEKQAHLFLKAHPHLKEKMRKHYGNNGTPQVCMHALALC